MTSNAVEFTGVITHLKDGTSQKGTPWAFATIAQGAPGENGYSQLRIKTFKGDVVGMLKSAGVGGEVTIQGKLEGEWKVEALVEAVQVSGPPAAGGDGFDEVPF